MKSKIVYKLIFAVGFVVITTIGIFSYININSQYNELISQTKKGIDQISETVKSSTKHDMLAARRDQLHHTIDSIGQQEGIEKIRIFNKEGAIIFSSDKKEMGTMVDKQGEACYACHAADQPLTKLPISERTRIFKNDHGVRNLGIINPIFNERSCWLAGCHAHKANQNVLGVLDITMSLEKVDEQIHANQIKMVLFTIIFIVIVSFLLLVLVQKFVGNPVHHLVEATNYVAEGDLSHKIKVESHDELGNLAKAFNQMTERLSDALRQIYQQDKLASLGRLAAGIAHEINNPLTGVLTYSSVLLRQAKEKNLSTEELEIIVRETKRCREIIRGLLNFGRNVPSKRTNIDLNEIINQSLTIVANQLAIQNVSVKKIFQEALPSIHADGNQMQQVFINLLVNAIDANNGSEGEIVIQTDTLWIEGKKYVQVSISDTGCGISKEDLPKIFDPFFTSKGMKGTGLGLAVVWGIIDQHEGNITVKSEVQKGTTFTIRFPIELENLSRLIKNKK